MAPARPSPSTVRLFIVGTALSVAVGAVSPVPAFDLVEEIEQFGTARCGPVVGAIRALVVLHEVLFAEVVQGVGQGAGVYCTGARLGYSVVKPGVT